MITVYDVEQGTDQWHELRAGRYTGSNAHKLLKYGAIEYAKTEHTKFKGNFFTERGHSLEIQAVSLYEKLTHKHVERPGFITNSNYPTAGFSPDGYISNDRIIECKAFNKTRHMAIYNGDIPLEIQAQIHFGMLICELKQADLVIYNPYFAKREIDGIPNPDYSPRLAIKIIPIKHNAKIANNFKRLLTNDMPVLQPTN